NGCTRDKATSRPTTHRVLRGGEARLYQMAELWNKRQSERCRRDWKTRRMEDVEFANTALDQPLNLLVPAEVRQQRASAARVRLIHHVGEDGVHHRPFFGI